MSKWFCTFAITVAVVSLIAGCPPKDERPDDNGPVVDVNETPIVEPNEAEAPVPPVIEPNEVVPNEVVVEPNDTVEPNEPVIDVNEPIVDANEPVVVDANTPVVDVNAPVEPNTVEPSDANDAVVIEVNEPADPNIVAVPDPNQVVEPNDIQVVEPNVADSNNVPEPVKVAFHDKCSELLKTYVTDEGLVNYSVLSRKRLELKALLREFEKLDPKEYASWPEADRLAFWINAYNIQMLHVIAQNYPIVGSPWLIAVWGSDSIRHVKGIGTDYRFVVMGETYTLDEVERRYFRRDSVDPKALLALNQGCLSGPPLWNQPYTGDDLDKQLDTQVKRFLADKDSFQIDKDGSEVILSSLLQATWYGKAFEKKYGTDKNFKEQPGPTRAVLNFLCGYLDESQVSYLEIGTYSVRWSKFDWTVNDKSKR